MGFVGFGGLLFGVCVGFVVFSDLGVGDFLGGYCG